MISFKDTWQMQRQQRQCEVNQRQQHVRQTLDRFQQERLAEAAKLRYDLNCFQRDLQHDTQDFLARTTAHRQLQAQHLTQQLRDFTQRLQRQTAQLMAMNAADRASMSQQLFHDLGEFHTHLTAIVATLRQEMQSRMQQIQTEVQSLQISTQQMLKAIHEQRIQDQIRLMQNLSSYVTALQLEIRDYLTEMELVRHDRAQQLQQRLQQEHNRRMADMKALFQQLSEFRTELRLFCQNLHVTVWGKAPTPIVASAQPASVPTNSLPTTTIVRPTRTLIQKLSMPTPSPSVVPAVESSRSAPENSEQLEKNVYQHICQNRGVRLAELETEMHITRLQAVDALRSLIQQGLVTQRDRLYLAQEEYSL